MKYFKSSAKSRYIKRLSILTPFSQSLGQKRISITVGVTRMKMKVDKMYRRFYSRMNMLLVGLQKKDHLSFMDPSFGLFSSWLDCSGSEADTVFLMVKIKGLWSMVIGHWSS